GTVVEARNGVGTVEAAALRLDVPVPNGAVAGEAIEIAIRPENIRLAPANGHDRQTTATISDRVFLGNVSEYYATLASGQVLRVQTTPLQLFAVGDAVAVEIAAAQCSVFRRSSSDAIPLSPANGAPQ